MCLILHFLLRIHRCLMYFSPSVCNHLFETYHDFWEMHKYWELWGQKASPSIPLTWETLKFDNGVSVLGYDTVLFWYICGLSLEAFAVTESSEIFSGRQPCQNVKVFRCFRVWLHSHPQGIGGLVEPNQFWFYQTTSNTLKMGTESVPETLENLHILMWLSVQENFIEYMWLPTIWLSKPEKLRIGDWVCESG